MSDKPSYVGLLNAISVGECRGYALLKAWSETTQDAALKGTLDVVAIREHEHSVAFEKRLCELGFSVREKASPEFDAQLACLESREVSDREKFERLLGFDQDDAEDPFAKMFDDTTIDPVTGGLLGRYIAEERDSARMLRAEYDRITAKPPADAEDTALAEISARLDKLTATLEELKSQRGE